MEGSHSILLIQHPEFNPHAAWPRATVSAFHYLSPSNSAFKAEPRTAFASAMEAVLPPAGRAVPQWSLMLLEVMEGE